MNHLFKLLYFIIYLLVLLPVDAISKPVAYKSENLDGVWDFRTITGVFTNDQATHDATDDWMEINVPSNWYKQNFDHAGTAIYRKFLFVENLSIDNHYIIQFDGVDYALDLWINDQFVGSHEGYFQHFDFDISTYLNEGENVIHAVVHSPNEEFGSSWSLHKNLIKGIFSHHDTRPGGAWSPRGQEKNTGGIWNSVRFITTGSHRLLNLQVKPNISDDETGSLSIQFAMKFKSKKKDLEFHIRLTPLNFQGASITRIVNPQKVSSNLYTFDISQGKIERWWPFELGAPNQYELELSIVNDGVITDTIRRSYAYRTIKRNSKTGQWYINNKRLFLRGTNYIPTQWLSEMSAKEYDIDLGLMRSANINSVRVHAHIGDQTFYDAADRMGMLVWQDFPLQWGYSDTEAFKLEASDQATAMVQQFGHHPSIFAWSLHNEPPWDADWMKYKYPDYNENQNRHLTNTLYELVLSLDDSRYTHSHSATSEHPWLGWYSGSWLDYAKPTEYNLITEFGAQALPDLSALRRILPEEAVWPDNEEDWKLWSYHNFQKHELTNIAGVSLGNSIEELIDNTQTYQATLTKYAAESLRRQKYNPVGGIFQFMFNEDWPSMNWGVLDYWRNPKPGYRALKIAFQPILISLEWTKLEYEIGDTINVGLWVINDLHEKYPSSSLELKLTNNSNTSDAGYYHIDIEPDSNKNIANWTQTLNESGEYTLIARLISVDNNILSTNYYNFEVK